MRSSRPAGWGQADTPPLPLLAGRVRSGAFHPLVTGVKLREIPTDVMRFNAFVSVYYLTVALK
jgi:hypothetical protein